ncbi:MAG: hypothetical protein ACR2H6_03700 [Pyrinomonadaceae bacterium]
MNREPPHAVTEPIGSIEVEARPSLVGSNVEALLRGLGSSNHSRPSVNFHIDELVLHGFESARRYAIGDAMQRELTRLFTEEGAPVAITDDVEIAHLNGGAIDVSPSANGEATGIQLARKIYGGLAQ